MKFVGKTGKLQDNNYTEDEFEYEETSKMRWIPSYNDVVKNKRKRKTQK